MNAFFLQPGCERAYAVTFHRAVKEKTAAEMLELPPHEFRRLVAGGALPPPILIGTHERWRVRDIDAILDGSAAIPDDDIE